MKDIDKLSKMNADNEADGWLEIIQKAQAAIKKAKGEA